MNVRDACNALLSGILLGLAFPLPNVQILAWFGLVPLLKAIEGKSPGASFVYGYLSGISFITVSLYWLYIYHFLAFPVVALILSLCPALFCLLFNLIKKRGQATFLGKSSLSPFLVPILWTGLEFIRSTGPLGFPWSSLGYSQYRNLPLIQLAAFTGVFGVSFLIVLVNSLVYHYTRRRQRLTVAIAVVIIVWVMPAVTQNSLQSVRRAEPSNGIKIAAIQGNVSSDADWAQDQRLIMNSLSKLSLRSVQSQQAVNLIIWAESAIREPLNEVLSGHSELKKEIKDILKKVKCPILTGSLYINSGRCYNSAFLLSPNGELLGRYDKIHLVPMGEFIPLSKRLPALRKIFPRAGNYSRGTRRVIFTLPDGKTKFAVLICFEGIFGNLTRSFVKDGAHFLINITNDAWSGSHAAHSQHASIAAFRAVENRVYLIRAGNSGISRIINPYGVIEENLGYNLTGFITGQIFPASVRTFYTRYGDVFGWTILGICILLLIAATKGIFF